jgi:hypothetical protein
MQIFTAKTMKRVAPVLPLIFLSLLAAIWAGWIRIGWSLPLSNLSAQHGGLMVNSFLASLIFLERAVTFKKVWWLALPFVNAFSLVAFLVHQPLLAQGLWVVGSLGFTALCSYFVYRYRELYYFVFLAGAFCLASGNVILLRTDAYSDAVTWWMEFLLLTIVAERLELSRFLGLTKAKQSLLLGCLLTLLLSLFWPLHLGGNTAFAISLSATAIWLLRYDMARHSVKVKGQHRYSALLLIAGYVWLLITAGLLMVQKSLPFGYDAVLHSFFVGFVFSMIFSHAPIILPAIAKMPVKIYRPFLYGWFGLLQFSLLLRVLGDVLGHPGLRETGGLANGAVILLFFVSVAALFRTEVANRKALLRKA